MMNKTNKQILKVKVMFPDVLLPSVFTPQESTKCDVIQAVRHMLEIEKLAKEEREQVHGI